MDVRISRAISKINFSLPQFLNPNINNDAREIALAKIKLLQNGLIKIKELIGFGSLLSKRS